MELLCIGIKGEVKEIDNILKKKIDIFEKEDLDINRQIKKVGETTYLDYSLANEKKCKYPDIRNIFKHYIAGGIADIILEFYQERIIEKIIDDKCFYLDFEEKSKLKENAVKYLENNDYVITEGITYKVSKKAKILKAILGYLEFSNEINIDGFVNFRLKFFIDMVDDAIDKTLEDFIIEKEYLEFIKILQYFVDIQTPKKELVNVTLERNKYTLYDEKMNLIQNEFMEEFAEEMFDNDMNYDDLLISSLITIAPNKIVIHADKHNKDNQVIEVIQNIFANKSTICEGCQLCKSLSNSQINGKANKE
ncbi:putative sporulation protein YtxC [Sporosalibacterium faouarense]|uniref:putative sporulation protein YtxC n=1 Tax=Sporosalibacterium faouarense TaxID=516123 RepID=UPI00192A873B|nr:putative sporulation protein YtxC [Sporosalibacterium faouarense]